MKTGFGAEKRNRRGSRRDGALFKTGWPGRILPFSAAFLVLLLLVSCAFMAKTEKSAVEITLLHVNDTHGHIIPYIDKSVDETQPVGGAAYLSALVEGERRKNPEGTLLLSAGDMFQGTPESNLFRGGPVIEIMNVLRFDAMTLGNHEFDWGLPVLEDMEKASDFPFLSANVVDETGRYLPGVKPYVILERKGLKTGVIGLTTADTPYTTTAKNVAGLTFLEPERVLPSLLQQVRGAGATLVVVLSHLGLEEDRKLAAAVPGIPVIVGGHSHTAVDPPLVVNGTLIVQAKCYGDYLGVLRLRVDRRNGRILDYTKKGELVTVHARGGDPRDGKVAGIVERYQDKVRKEFETVVAVTETALTGNRDGESLLGNLVCDAMREAAGTPLAFYNAGGLRADISPGPVTLGDIYTVLPFDSVLMTMDLTGADILDALEQGATGEYGILQLSGMKVRLDLTRPKGKRVAEATMGNVALQGNETYRATIQDFLAGGGDHYRSFQNGKNIQNGGLVREAVIGYMKRHTPVRARPDGRIEISP